MKAITGETREEVWLEALKYLRYQAEGNIEYNLILEVSKPSLNNIKQKMVRASLDKLLANSELTYPVHTVSETIFPAFEYKKYGINGVLTNYPNDVYPLIRSNRGNNKGTYAYRIVRGVNHKNECCNPLELVIARLKSQLASRSKIRCAYDMSLDQVETIPINLNDKTTRGFPCLSHLSFKLSRNREELHLTALYRSHSYIEKALGNLLGLARLQKCVADEVGVGVGTLVCHSTYAVLDMPTGIGKAKIDQFVKEVEGYS